MSHSETSTKLTPEPGQIYRNPYCTLAVESQHPLDSVAFAIEYRSDRGMLRKKSIGTVTIPPFSMILDIRPLKNQYFYGANAIAKLYRKDDTLQIINSPRLFLLPDSIPKSTIEFYPSSYKNAPFIPFYQNTSLAGVKITHDPGGIDIHFNIPQSQKSPTSISGDGITIVLDPLSSSNPFPGNNTVILYIPVKGDAQLITSAEQGGEDFSIARTGTKISLDAELTKNSTLFQGKVRIPDFLLGGTTPDSIGINLIIPHQTDKGEEILSLIPGEEFKLYTPALFPVLVKTVPPVEKTNPFVSFGAAFGIGFLIMGIVILAKRVPVASTSDILLTDNVILKTIDEHIVSHDLSPNYLANLLKRSEKELNKECQRLTGKKIPTYIQWARIEIVKERLVSSNASEISIAKECGFRTVADMENAFHHHTGIAPYQFRERNGIK